MQFSHRLVPPEVIAEILSYHFQLPLWEKRPANYYSPTQVCSLWRDAALCNPRNWASLEVKVDFRALADRTSETVHPHNDGDQVLAMERTLSEFRWRIQHVKNVPIDLAIVFENHRYLQYALQLGRVVETIRDCLRTALQPHNNSNIGPVRLKSYKEQSLHPGYRIQTSFFDIILPLMQRYQYETLTRLDIQEPKLHSPINFPKLHSLTINGDAHILKTLARINAPSLSRLHISDCIDCDLAPDAPEHYLAPLISRYPLLETLLVSGSLSSKVTQFQHLTALVHPTVTCLDIFPDVSETWRLSPFLSAFPNLQVVYIQDDQHYSDQFDSVTAAKRVYHLTLPNNVGRELALRSFEVFPNLTTLYLGCPIYRMGDSDEPGFTCPELYGMLTETKDVDGKQVHTIWPQLGVITLTSSRLDKYSLLALIYTLYSRKSNRLFLVTEACFVEWGGHESLYALPNADYETPHALFSAVSDVLKESIGLSREELVEELVLLSKQSVAE